MNCTHRNFLGNPLIYENTSKKLAEAQKPIPSINACYSF